jgi:pimeloyl-ACP methyl ester carboxylesterase
MLYLFVIVACTVVAWGVSVVTRYLRAMNAARARIAGLGSRVIETACGPIEYAQAGSGYPLLVVHGAMGGFDQGLWLARNFDVRHYRVIAVSRFGYLRSPVPAGATLDSQADAFAGLLDALHIQQAAVFAISAGTTSAIRFAARHPQRVSALILLCPDAPGEVQMALPSRFVFETLLRSDFIYWALNTYFAKRVQSAIGLVPKGYTLTPAHEAQLRTIQSGDLPASKRIDGMIFESYTLAPEFNAFVTAASPYPLGELATPTLVINALDDPISIPANVRVLAGQIPNARLFLVPDGGHLLFGHMQEVRAEINRFLHRSVNELGESESLGLEGGAPNAGDHVCDSAFPQYVEAHAGVGM